MTPKPNVRRPWHTLALLALALAVPLAIFAQQAADDDLFTDSPYLRIDPAKIVTTPSDNPCGNCHGAELAVWDTTQHARNFDELHKRPRARQILSALDLTVAKRESLCLKCHYTTTLDENDGLHKAVAGVSCESCHGAARDWIAVHGQVLNARQAGDEARVEQIIRDVEAAGMLRPSSNLYGVAANCFECHTVPHEQLVNEGGHSTGTAGFDLLTQYGRIKHNYVDAQRGGPTLNRPLTPEHRRLLFVVGRMLDYEYSIRGIARATTTAGPYLTNMVNRVDDAFYGLEDILLAMDAAGAGLPEVRGALQAGKVAEYKPGNRAALLAVADRLRELGQQFTTAYDGSTLAPLDPLLAGEPAPRPAVVAAPPPAPTPEAGVPADAGATNAAPSSASPTPSAPSAAGRVVAEGPVVNPPAWFPRYDHAFVQPGCNCHGKALDWHEADRHSRTAAPFVARHPRAVQIAERYGLSADQMALAGSLCMNCHSTPKTRSQGRPVRTGVTCEGCHGPAEAYIDTHDRGGNPRDGMTALKRADARAANCSRCHYITDQRLLSAGHPTGADYDFAEANTLIVHWPDDRNVRRDGPYPAVSGSDLAAAFARIKAGRPVPAFTPVATAPSASGGTPRNPAAAASTPDANPASATPSSPAPDAGWDDWDAVLDAGGGGGTASGALGTPYVSPLAAIPDSASTEEILLLLKQRLERLYQKQ